MSHVAHQKRNESEAYALILYVAYGGCSSTYIHRLCSPHGDPWITIGINTRRAVAKFGVESKKKMQISEWANRSLFLVLLNATTPPISVAAYICFDSFFNLVRITYNVQIKHLFVALWIPHLILVTTAIKKMKLTQCHTHVNHKYLFAFFSFRLYITTSS